MGENPCLDPSSQQFKQQLNQWFEQHGVLDNLRSHLRSVMITALQKTEIRLRPNQKATPKTQSVNLLVAEYLIKHGCHYTLSVLMSELPALSNFASGGVPKTGEKSRAREKYRFQEKEVVEMLNSLGVSSSDGNLKLIWECYDRNKDEESLLECLLRFIPKRCCTEAEMWDEAQERDIMKSVGDNRHSRARRLLPRMSECELKRTVQEENERRMRELIEREKRIQDHLRNHEEEMVQRLQSAEKELASRRDTIDRELSERQLHLGRIAFQLKDKHGEIMELSRNFAAIKSENVALTAKLESVQVELNELREELEKKTEIIGKLEAERMSLKCHVQEYLKWKNGGMDGEALSSNLDNCVRPENEQTMNSSSSQDGSPSSDEEALLYRVKDRVEKLDSEHKRIYEKYMECKKKYESEVEDSDEEESRKTSMPATTSDMKQPECVTVAETPIEPAERVIARKDVEVEVIPVAQEIISKKTATVEEEKRTLIPTKRQQKNLEYYHRSRSLMEALERSAGFAGGSDSSSTSDLSRSEGEESRKSEKVKARESAFAGGKDAGTRDLTDLECLALLKEATVKEAPKGVEGSETVVNDWQITLAVGEVRSRGNALALREHPHILPVIFRLYGLGHVDRRYKDAVFFPGEEGCVYPPHPRKDSACPEESRRLSSDNVDRN